MVTTHWRAMSWVLLVPAMLTLLLGCGGAEPTRFTKIEDAKMLASTRSDVKSIFATAAEPRIDAAGGREDVRGGRQVVDPVCDEIYGEQFRTLEVRGSFVVRGLGLADVIEKVRRAWERQGWDVDVTDDDRVFLETKTATGVRVIGSATIGAAENDAKKVGVGLVVGTGCLKLPGA